VPDKYFIAVVKHGVNFGFSIKGLTRNDIEKFEGSGKTMRNIKFESIEDIDEKRLVDLIKLVHTKAKAVST